MSRKERPSFGSNNHVLASTVSAMASHMRGGLVGFRHHAYEPSDGEIRSLIGQAVAHPLGIDFLREGALDAVAATFSVHAFVVEQARLHLSGMPAVNQSQPAEATVTVRPTGSESLRIP